jgi:hypothetical protein
VIGGLIAAAALAGGAWAFLRPKKLKASSGSLTYANGWIGEWRIAKLDTGWLGQFRISQAGFGQAAESGWLNVPHGIADTAKHAKSLALEQLALNDPSNPSNQIVDSGNVTQGGFVYHWAVLRIVDTGLYRPLVAKTTSAAMPEGIWPAIAADRIKPQEARNLALEYIAEQA